MNISLTGNPKAMTARAGAAEAQPAAEGAPMRETPQQAPNLTVTATPMQAETGGVPPAKIEKAITRTDGLGTLVDKTLADVVPKDVPEKIREMLLESQYKTAKATIDNLKPSPREIEMRKELLKREAQKADEQRAVAVAAEKRRAELTAGLLPGEKGPVLDELSRIPVRV